MSELEFSHNLDNNRIEIRIIGEINISTVKQFENYLEYIVSLHESDIRIHCDRLTYVDSLGINVLLRLLKKVNARDNRILLCRMGEHIRKLFRITDLEPLFIFE